jgi:protein associated with RNAse G/E
MFDLNNIVTINSRKLDGKINKSWKAKLIEKNDNLLKFVGKFENEIKHEHLGVIRRGTVSYEFYWLDRGFNVFRFHEPEGNLRNFYCNINLPPQLENNVLDYIDLDIDVLVWKDFRFQILDLKEFEENAENFSYSDDLKLTTDESLKELVHLIENRKFPFDYNPQN